MRRLAGVAHSTTVPIRRAIHHLVTMSKQRVNKTAARGDLLPLCYHFSKVAGPLPDTRDEEMIMADNFDIFNNVLNEFQKLDGGSARKQVIKALHAMDKNLSAVESQLNTAVQVAVEKERGERAAAERESIDKAVAEAVAKDRQERGARAAPASPPVTPAAR